MKRAGFRFLKTVAIFLALAGYGMSSFACGFHDPELMAQRVLTFMPGSGGTFPPDPLGDLSQTYPNCLQVSGAIQQARRAGELPSIDLDRYLARGETRKQLDQIAFANAMNALFALSKAIDRRGDQEPIPDLSLVLLDSMLWARYSSEYFDLRQGLHVEGPEQGDIVMVTDEPVIDAIQDGRMSVAHAAELGVIRIYATEQARNTLLDQLGTIGEEPLPRTSFQRTAAIWNSELQ